MLSPCSQPVASPDVIRAVVEQMEAYRQSGSPARIPASMELQPCMRSALLEDAVVGVVTFGVWTLVVEPEPLETDLEHLFSPFFLCCDS
jgi:hypothetical protein